MLCYLYILTVYINFNLLIIISVILLRLYIAHFDVTKNVHIFEKDNIH